MNRLYIRLAASIIHFNTTNNWAFKQLIQAHYERTLPTNDSAKMILRQNTDVLNPMLYENNEKFMVLFRIIYSTGAIKLIATYMNNVYFRVIKGFPHAPSMAFMIHQVPLTDKLLDLIDDEVIEFLILDVPYDDEDYCELTDLGDFYLHNLTLMCHRLGFDIKKTLILNINQGLTEEEIEEDDTEEYIQTQIEDMFKQQKFTDCSVIRHLKEFFLNEYKDILLKRVSKNVENPIAMKRILSQIKPSREDCRYLLELIDKTQSRDNRRLSNEKIKLVIINQMGINVKSLISREITGRR